MNALLAADRAVDSPGGERAVAAEALAEEKNWIEILEWLQERAAERWHSHGDAAKTARRGTKKETLELAGTWFHVAAFLFNARKDLEKKFPRRDEDEGEA
jgi:hypothetical protein